jgi:hypothetical protein
VVRLLDSEWSRSETGPAPRRLGGGEPTSRAHRNATDLDNFARRAIFDAITQGLAATSIRRAEAFEAAMPRAGEYQGRATGEQLRRRWYECREIARAFRARAELCDSAEFIDELDIVLDEEASWMAAPIGER